MSGRVDTKMLRELLAKALPAGVVLDTEGCNGCCQDGDRACGTSIDFYRAEDGYDGLVVGNNECSVRGVVSPERAALIVAAVNALPALLDEADVLRARLAYIASHGGAWEQRVVRGELDAEATAT